MDKIYQKNIAAKVKELRHQRGLTQKNLASYLGLSQSRLSELEAGQGSFSAEHLLLLSKKFNVTASSFASHKQKAISSIQNALIRLGAEHLREDEETLPSEILYNVINIVREVLNAPESHRALAALASIIVKHAEPQLLNRLRLQLKDDGLIQRFGWLLENIRAAIDQELKAANEPEWKSLYERADFILKNLLSSSWVENSKNIHEDILDSVVTPKTLEQIRKSASKISKKWGIVTRLQADDFARALKESRESH